MNKYESSVKHIPSPIESVYGKLSDLTNLEVLRERLSDPALRETMLQQADDAVKPEQMEQYVRLLENMQLTPDTLTVDVPMLGETTLHIVERQEPKLVKFETEGSPLQSNLWIQLLPEGEERCAMKLTVGIELNFLMKQMLGSKLQSGVERLADMLTAIPY